MDDDLQALVFIIYFVANILVLYLVNRSRFLNPSTERVRPTKNPGHFRPRVFGHRPKKIRSGDLLPLPAPSQQTQRAEAGDEERECGGQWGFGHCMDS